MYLVAYQQAEGDDRVELSFVTGLCRFAPNEAADDPEAGVATCTLLCETEAINSRRPRYPNPDSDTLERPNDRSPMAALCQ